jgi:YD repeat-containing protein
MRFIVALLAFLASDAAMAQQQTFRDANGRTLGRSVTDSRGNTVFYDAMGRTTGRSVTNGGTTTTHDQMGRQTGTIRGSR